MRGDFTRDTRERARRMSTRSVLLQQGRQLLDADWNAQAGLTAARAEATAVDTVGGQGAPREEAGFEVTGGAGDVRIGAGVIYAEGLRCHNRAAVGYAEQMAEGILPALVESLPDGAEGLVYLEALTRPAMEADDPLLAEPALGGADTVVHEIVEWAVRVTPLNGLGMSREALVTAIDRNQPLEIGPWGRTTGGLSADVQTEDEVADPGPCELPATAGYLDQVNRLFQVVIRDAGPPGTATFTWTEDAGIEAGLRAESAGFAVDLPPQRAAHLFPAGAVVEVLDRDRQRAGVPGPVGTITSAPGATLTVDGIAGAELGTHVRLRRWAELPRVVPAATAWTVLSRGVQVRFAPGRYERGAAWTVPARTRTGDILWPPYPTPDLTVAIGGEGDVGFYAPDDGRRHHAALALVRRAGETYTVTRDLRQIFAPLTDLTADLVRYDGAGAGLVATDVQEAIDELAARRGGHCTYTADPRPGWETVFDLIPAGANATVCLPVGNFPLTAAVEVRGKGHVRVVGAGPGTKVWCYGDTTALRFRDCRSVQVADLTVAAENRSPWKPRAGTMTMGALDVAQCGSVRVERATLIAGGTRWRQATCLRIDAGAGWHRGGGDVVVTDCDIVAGDLAGGILVLDAVTARIRDNRIRPRAEEPGRTVKRWSDDAMAAASFGRLLLSNSTTTATVTRPRTRAEGLFRQQSVTLGDRGRTITFLTLNSVSSAVWEQFASAYRARADLQPDLRILRLDLRELAGSVLAGGGRVQASGVDFTGFRAMVDSLTRVVAPVIDTGIVVAGSSAGDVAISGNVVDGALQGVRVAVANGTISRLRPRSVRVEANRIRLAVVPLDRPRHGIYLGNSDRAWVVDNDIALETTNGTSDRAKLAAALGLDKLFAAGIHVYGGLGPLLQVRGNVVQGCSDGITVWSYTSPTQRLRLLDGNLITGASTPWRIRGGATRVNNTPV